jgi:hypothetical protein
LSGEHDGAYAIASRRRCVEIDVPMYEPCAGAAAGAAFLVVAVVDFLGGMAAEVRWNRSVDGDLVLLVKGELQKLIRRWSW